MKKGGKAEGRKKATGPSKEGPRPGFLACPECDKHVKEGNLESHLRRVHGMPAPEARARANELLEGPSKDVGGRTFLMGVAALVIIIVLAVIGVYLYLMQSHETSGPGDNNTDYLPIAFTTSDGWDIHGDLYTGTSGKPYLVLVHGMNEDRKAYRTFAKEMHSKGYGIVSYDSRGFGESKVKNGTYVAVISKEDIRMGTRDIKAAMDALEQRQLTGNGVVLVGASVGANVVAIYAVNDSRVKDIVLLSAGDDYQGVRPMDAIRAYTGGILFVAYNGDDIAHESSMRFYANATKASVRHEFYKSGLLHGTGALTQSDMRSKIEAWIISPA